MSEKHGSHWLEREDFGEVTVVRLKMAKLLDEDAVRIIFDPIYTLVGLGRTKLVLNLAVVEYLPSMAVAKLVMLNRKVQAAGGRLNLCQPADIIQQIFETTRVSDLLTSFATEQEALQAFA